MKEILDLKEDIREEIKDAAKYARKALAFKEENSEKADLYRKLSEGELCHMDMLHAEVVREIKKWREETGKEPPPEMQARYDILHKIAMEDANEVKLMLKILKEA